MERTIKKRKRKRYNKILTVFTEGALQVPLFYFQGSYFWFLLAGMKPASLIID